MHLTLLLFHLYVRIHSRFTVIMYNYLVNNIYFIFFFFPQVEVELLREDNEQLVTQYEREKQLRKTSEQVSRLQQEEQSRKHAAS